MALIRRPGTISKWINIFSFTFGAGTNLGDIVSYYIVAQDDSHLTQCRGISMHRGSGFTINPPACSTPPANPSTYTIIASISGTFHVGVGKPYTTLTSAINDLNSK